MSSNRQFKESIQKFKTDAVDLTERRAKRIVLRTFSEVNKETPVDQGILRANWEIGQSSAAAKFNPDAKDKTGDMIAARAMSWIGANRIVGTWIFISNKTPYARRIEYDGWSRSKKPNGMVGVAVRRMRRLIAAKKI